MALAGSRCSQADLETPVPINGTWSSNLQKHQPTAIFKIPEINHLRSNVCEIFHNYSVDHPSTLVPSTWKSHVSRVVVHFARSAGLATWLGAEPE